MSLKDFPQEYVESRIVQVGNLLGIKDANLTDLSFLANHHGMTPEYLESSIVVTNPRKLAHELTLSPVTCQQTFNIALNNGEYELGSYMCVALERSDLPMWQVAHLRHMLYANIKTFAQMYGVWDPAENGESSISWNWVWSRIMMKRNGVNLSDRGARVHAAQRLSFDTTYQDKIDALNLAIYKDWNNRFDTIAAVFGEPDVASVFKTAVDDGQYYNGQFMCVALWHMALEGHAVFAEDDNALAKFFICRGYITREMERFGKKYNLPMAAAWSSMFHPTTSVSSATRNFLFEVYSNWNNREVLITKFMEK